MRNPDVNWRRFAEEVQVLLWKCRVLIGSALVEERLAALREYYRMVVDINELVAL